MKTMDLNTPIGAKVKFSYPDNGRDMDIVYAQTHLVVDMEYTVKSVHVGQSSSTVELKEIPGFEFNTVQFSNSDGLTTIQVNSGQAWIMLYAIMEITSDEGEEKLTKTYPNLALDLLAADLMDLTDKLKPIVEAYKK